METRDATDAEREALLEEIRKRNEYSLEERARMLEGMRHASKVFYALACRAENHAFIEFTGLLNEYLKLCELAHREGRDFTRANVHTGAPLVLEAKEHDAEYLGEKFGCVFETTFAGRPELIDAFCRRAFGVERGAPAPIGSSA